MGRADGFGKKADIGRIGHEIRIAGGTRTRQSGVGGEADVNSGDPYFG